MSDDINISPDRASHECAESISSFNTVILDYPVGRENKGQETPFHEGCSLSDWRKPNKKSQVYDTIIISYPAHCSWDGPMPADGLPPGTDPW